MQSRCRKKHICSRHDYVDDAHVCDDDQQENAASYEQLHGAHRSLVKLACVACEHEVYGTSNVDEKLCTIR